MLKIVSSSDPLKIENIVLTVYAAPGLGKSSLGFTADKPLMLDFDKGAHRAATRGDTVPVSSWSDIAQMTAEDLAPYNTIIIDTAGRALDSLASDIIAVNPKEGRGDGSLTRQGYMTLKSRFAQWQSFLRSKKKDVVLICHMDEQKNGDETQERIDAQGASKNEIYKSSDAMCRIRLNAKDERYLDFDPRQGGFGKNPAQLPKISFPDPRQNPCVLADVIAQIKTSFNQMTEAQAQEKNEGDIWTNSLSKAKSPEEFNLLLNIAQERKYRIPMKKELMAAATAAGMVFSKEEKMFVEGIYESTHL